MLCGQAPLIDTKNLTHREWVDLFTERDLETRLKDIVYDLIKSTGKRGATVDEIIAICRIPAGTVKARRAELEVEGLICDSGLRRLSARDRPTKVYVAT